MRKRLGMVCLTAAMVLGMTMTSFAGQWKQDAAGWWWKNDDGSYPANGWKWIDGNNDGTAECYYFNENGYMLANATTPDNYQVNADGAWVVNDVVQTVKEETSASASVKEYSNNKEEDEQLKISEQTEAENEGLPFELYKVYDDGGTHVYFYYTFANGLNKPGSEDTIRFSQCQRGVGAVLAGRYPGHYYTSPKYEKVGIYNGVEYFKWYEGTFYDANMNVLGSW